MWKRRAPCSVQMPARGFSLKRGIVALQNLESQALQSVWQESDCLGYEWQERVSLIFLQKQLLQLDGRLPQVCFGERRYRFPAKRDRRRACRISRREYLRHLLLLSLSPQRASCRCAWCQKVNPYFHTTIP